MTPPFQELRELLEKATKGPWYTLDQPWLPTDAETAILAESNDPHVARFICDFDLWAIDQDDRKSENPDDDAALIVAAVNALPELLDRSDRLARIEQVEPDDLEARLRSKYVQYDDDREMAADALRADRARISELEALVHSVRENLADGYAGKAIVAIDEYRRAVLKGGEHKHRLTDEKIAEYWPDMDHPEGRAEIRRQFDKFLHSYGERAWTDEEIAELEEIADQIKQITPGAHRHDD